MIEIMAELLVSRKRVNRKVGGFINRDFES